MRRAVIIQLKILLYLAFGIVSAYIVYRLYLSVSAMRFGVAFLGGSLSALILEVIMSLFESSDADSKFKNVKNGG